MAYFRCSGGKAKIIAYPDITMDSNDTKNISTYLKKSTTKYAIGKNLFIVPIQTRNYIVSHDGWEFPSAWFTMAYNATTGILSYSAAGNSPFSGIYVTKFDLYVIED